MDDYPAGSLDHSIPFLLTLGVSNGAFSATYDSALSPILKEQAILIRSELPTLDDEQAHALLQYIQDRDASNLPCNAKEAAKRYRFRVRTAERVRHLLSLELIYASNSNNHSPSSSHPAAPDSPTESRSPPRRTPRSSTRPTPP